MSSKRVVKVISECPIQCADMLDINWEVIERCANSNEGKELLARAGGESLGVKHHLSFIPTVALNSDFSEQNLRLKNLLSTVCNAFNVSHSCKNNL